MNAHQRRKARRAKERATPPYVLFVHPEDDWMRELMKPAEVPEGVTLLSGEIGWIEGIPWPTRQKAP